MSASEPMLDADARWRNLLLRAYGRFHEIAQTQEVVSPGLLPYTASDRVSAANGDLIWVWGVPTEVRETINSLNAWSVHLRDWGIWNAVLAEQSSEEDRWNIAAHFIEPIAFFCMLQPTSASERLVIASETTLHHANRLAFPKEPNRLEQDELKPGQLLRKKDRRKQLKRLGAPWSAFGAFFDALNELDGEDYRLKTRNFRDLSAHSFAPRLYVGNLSRAMRSVGPWEELVEQPDGTFVPTPHPTKKAVSYAIGDMPPLDLREMWESNLEEYCKAKSAMGRFSDLIDEVCSKI